MKRIVYTNPDNSVSMIIPAPDWQGTLEELAAKDVPAGLEWRIVEATQLPASRNWRNAWTDANPTDTVDVDLEKAKQEHLNLMVSVAAERVQPNAFGQRDFSQVEAEIEALRPQVEAATTLTELYNLWPASISKRSGQREYVVHKA
jgi:hypothetical protein